MSKQDPLFAPVPGADHREVAGVKLDTVQAGSGRVKRVVYPAGFRWSKDMKPLVGGDACMHAHVGFLVRGRVHAQYPDGCVVEFTAPQGLVIEPGHDAWVMGNEPAVLIEFDFMGDTASRFGLPKVHSHKK